MNDTEITVTDVTPADSITAVQRAQAKLDAAKAANDAPKSKPVPMRRGALVSECGLFRYSLGRQWDEAKPGITWIMLNPSTADGDKDDMTIRKCVEFSNRWGFGTLNVANLFAYRATDPKELVKRHMAGLDIIGPQNHIAIASIAASGSAIVLAWGTHALAMRQVPAVWNIIDRIPIPKVCLGVTANGSPRHPLYLAKTTRAKHWRLGSISP